MKSGLFVFIFAIVAVTFGLGGRSLLNLKNSRRFPPPAFLGRSEIAGSIFGRDLVQEARNKAFVVNYYQQVFGARNLTGIENWFGPNYIQHNPTLPDGKDGFINWLKSIFPPGTQPFTRFTIAHAAAEGDLVWIHNLNNVATIPDPAFDEAIVDIYRVQNGVMVEHFDVIQAVPVWSFNSHPMMDALQGQYPQQCAFGRVPPAATTN